LHACLHSIPTILVRQDNISILRNADHEYIPPISMSKLHCQNVSPIYILGFKRLTDRSALFDLL
jgi:hypothetical protein